MKDKIINEGNYCFDFTNSIAAYKADIPTYNGLSGVDFVVELEDKYLFIEFKDIDNSKVPDEERKRWIDQLQKEKGRDFLVQLGMKFKDTIMRQWACDKDFDKPIWYIVVLEFHAIDTATRIRLTENLSGQLPTCFNEKNGFVKNIKIKGRKLISVKAWKEQYPDFPLSEIVVTGKLESTDLRK